MVWCFYQNFWKGIAKKSWRTSVGADISSTFCWFELMSGRTNVLTPRKLHPKGNLNIKPQPVNCNLFQCKFPWFFHSSAFYLNIPLFTRTEWRAGIENWQVLNTSQVSLGSITSGISRFNKANYIWIKTHGFFCWFCSSAVVFHDERYKSIFE